jgi:hypothetical protein
MMTRMAKAEGQRPYAARGTGKPDSIHERHMTKGGKPQLRMGRKSFSRYAVAGLALIALGITWTLGVIGCSRGMGQGIMSETSGVFRQSPDEVSRLLRNAHYYKLMGRPELALKELEQAHQQNPDNLKIVNTLAQNYEALGQFETARKLYQEALSRNGPHPALANNSCFTYYLEGHWQKAEDCYRQILAQDPGNEAARNNLGLLYCRLGRQEEARHLWQETEGNAAAAYKIRQALAALGTSDSAVYAQAPEPVTPLQQGSTPTPVAAVCKPPAAADKQPVPAQPLAPQKVAMQLAPKPAPEKPVPDDVRPHDEIPPQPAPAEAPPTPAPAPAARAVSPPRPAPLTAVELVNTAIEVRNGNGSPDMARQIRTHLNLEGFTVASIGNHIDFGAETTIIYFRPESERIAQAVSRTLLPKAKLEPSTKLPGNIAVKILLGADLLDRPQLMARLAAEGQ